MLDGKVETVAGHVSVAMMHLAKGLEFRAVAVMACDDEILPLQERISAASDDADLEEVYNTERHLLYVAYTCAGSPASYQRGSCIRVFGRPHILRETWPRAGCR